MKFSWDFSTLRGPVATRLKPPKPAAAGSCSGLDFTDAVHEPEELLLWDELAGVALSPELTSLLIRAAAVLLEPSHVADVLDDHVKEQANQYFPERIITGRVCIG